jgi:putative exosortase-associated protein (TIGR04073 family)
MLKHKHLFLASVLAISAYAPASQADGYVSSVSEKFTRGVSNMFTGLGEVPKNIVNISNQTNPVIGSTGGLLVGTLNTLGRTASGVFDIVTSPLPTKSMVQPENVWTDFDKNTSYTYPKQ